MTYLNIVNKVLKLMREETVASVGDDDTVVQLVATYVNDAKNTVEDGWHFNALRYDWSETIAANASQFVLTDSGKLPIIEEVWGADGTKLKEISESAMRKKRYAAPAASGNPEYYSVDGQVNGDVRVRVFPAPSASYAVEAVGYKKQDDLELNDDRLLVPAQPVIYFAYALAARERGEVGGQTAAEIFGMAGEYLKNAIAHDAALNHYEQNWWVN